VKVGVKFVVSDSTVQAAKDSESEKDDEGKEKDYSAASPGA
jgi:hypothetical protein